MSQRQVFIFGIVYTLLMAVVVTLVPSLNAAAIIIAVANVWFWVGRMSVQERRATGAGAPPSRSGGEATRVSGERS